MTALQVLRNLAEAVASEDQVAAAVDRIGHDEGEEDDA